MNSPEYCEVIRKVINALIECDSKIEREMIIHSALSWPNYDKEQA